VATRLVLAGRNPFEFEGFVNTPIYRGSTVLSPTVAQFVGRTGRYQYGRRGTPTTDALAEGLAELGRAATLGTATWQCQHKFEIVLGPLSLGSFTQFLPGSRALAELHALVRFYTNGEWTWQLRLLLRDVEVPGATLGRMGQLGWSTWLAPSRVTADDVLIQEPRARGASSTVLDSLRPS